VRISQVRIRKYRCIEDLVLDIDDYTVLVGPNGSGKSSVLYALDWFFNGRSLCDDDLHCTTKEGDSAPEEPLACDDDDGEAAPSEIDVEVVFGELNDEDRRVLEKYGRGDVARFRRSWSGADCKEKMIGNSQQGPGFPALRKLTKVTELRPAYKKLREQLDDLADMPGSPDKETVFAELTRWENDPAHSEMLEEVKNEDATHMFGIDGEHKIARRMRLVLIPASTDIVQQVGMGKTSAVSQLVGSLMSEAVSTARVRWESEHADELTRLSDEIKAGVEKSTQLQGKRVNELLGSLVPNASIDFVPQVPSWSLRGDASILTDVVIDGFRKDVSRQGHGVQRAVMMSMLQALVPDTATVEASVEAGDLPDDEAEAKLHEELKKLPALLVCIEEPEIYQHPVRARHFARVLLAWSQKDNSQVLFATHSPYFVLPEQFDSLRRFHLKDGKTGVAVATVGDVASLANVGEARVERVMEKEIPRTFSEGFFADAVVFTEGDTDRVVLETISERLEQAFDAHGIAVLSMDSKDNYLVPRSILEKLGIRVYVVADADALGASRKHPTDTVRQKQARDSHKKSTEALVKWLPPSTALVGSLPYAFEDPTVVTERWTLFEDDLEEELSKWPELVAELAANNNNLRSPKSVAAYRAAVSDADLAGMPSVLKQLVSAILAFGTSASG